MSVHSFYFEGVHWELAVFTMLGVLWGGDWDHFLRNGFQYAQQKRLSLL